MEDVVLDFSVPATGDKVFRLSSQRVGPLVLYFYPRDNTPGCTTETAQFRDLYPEFSALGCDIYGLSRDTLVSHEKFKAKLGLPFDLLSDTAETVCQQFGVIKQKKLYGKDVRGIERSTFLIEVKAEQCVIRREWRGVKADGHASEVLQAVRELAGS